MTSPPRSLCVIGITDAGIDSLAANARATLDAADVIIGGGRHLTMISKTDAKLIPWPSPFSDAWDMIRSLPDKNICILATGDPMLHGVGVKLTALFPETRIIPAPSAFSLAAARLRWPLAHVTTISLHGASDSLIIPHLTPCARLLLLGTAGKTPAAVADILCRHGYGSSRIWIMEHLDGKKENIRQTTAAEFSPGDIADLTMLAVECFPDPATPLRSPLPGLPDDAFLHDGQITKREIRAMTLSALAPFPGALLWDVGAGCGSVAIEWMRTHPRNRAVAIEKNPDRCAFIEKNRENLGVPGLQIIRADAPQGFPKPANPANPADPHDSPGAVFLGGGVSQSGLLDACWNALVPGGRLVANAVSLPGEQALSAFRQNNTGELRRLTVSRAEPVGAAPGAVDVWRPLMTITQLEAVKP